MSRSSTNRRAAKAMARDEWDGLSESMREGLRDARNASRTARAGCGTLATAQALFDRGLISEASRWSKLTLWGLLVRAQGLAARAEAGL